MSGTVVLRIQVRGFDQIRRRLLKLKKQGTSLKVPLSRAGAVLLAEVDSNFQAEGRPRWKPRAPLTLAALRQDAMIRAARTKRYGAAKRFTTREKMLRQAAGRAAGTGLLGGSFRKSIVLRVFSTKLVIGSPHPGARIHQVGGVIRPKTARALSIPMGDRLVQMQQVTIPARPWLVVTPDAEKKVLRVFRDWLIQEGG